MSREDLLKNLAQKGFLSVFLTIVNAFSWYFPLHSFFTSTLESFQIGHTLVLEVYGTYYLGVIFFAIAGTVIVHKVVSRKNLLILWMLVGVVASLLLAQMKSMQNQETYLFVTALTLGISLGVGFPSCLAFFADYGRTENRGKLGGITYCISSIGIFAMALLIVLLPSFEALVIFAVWRIVGLIIFSAMTSKDRNSEDRREVGYFQIVRERSFILYFIPWLMFCLVNFLEGPVLKNFFSAEFFNLIPIMEFGIGGIVALIGGIFADLVGRKRIIIFGYIMLGVGYAILGLFSNEIISWYLYITVDGIAWGIFGLFFFLVIWGEIAENRIKDKFYLLGIMPFLASTYIELLVEPYAGAISVFASFSLASFFLFVAILPLIYAPETLPEKTIKDRELKSYLEKAQKVKEKYA
jgi:MFS family permease